MRVFRVHSRNTLLGLSLLAGGACRGGIGAPDERSTDDLPSAVASASGVADASPPFEPLPSRGGGLPPDVSGFLDAQVNRDPRDPSLQSALRESDDATLRRALWALARIGGHSARAALLSHMRGDDELGVLGLAGIVEDEYLDPSDPESFRWEDALWTRYAIAENRATVSALLFAIGRVGSESSVARLAQELARINPAEAGRTRDLLTALAGLCARGIVLDEAARDAVAAGLSALDPQIQEATTYALSRCVASSAELFSGRGREVILDRLKQILGQGIGDRHLWRAYAALGDLPDAIPPVLLSSSPPSWTVEVEAVRALVQTQAGRQVVVERMAEAEWVDWHGPRRYVALEALTGLRPYAAHDRQVVAFVARAKQQLRSAAGTGPAKGEERYLGLARWWVDDLSLIAGGRLGKQLDCEDYPLVPPVICGEAMTQRVLWMSARPRAEAKTMSIDGLAGGPSEARYRRAVTELLRLAADPQATIATPALGALAEVNDKRVGPVLAAALKAKELSVVSEAARALAVRARDSAQADREFIPDLLQALREHSGPEHVELRIEVIDALGRHAKLIADGQRASGKLVEAPTWMRDAMRAGADEANLSVRRAMYNALEPFAALRQAFVESPTSASGFGERWRGALPKLQGEPGPSRVRGLRVETTAGDFEIEFAGVSAPINQANLVSLVERKFYDGLIWHRVVPGFVVQSGDPRGDGYGGSGELVPCEWSDLRYERGTVGIATAGRDTGDSQLFITQTSQPHLDGRYTVVGHVEAGLEVVDMILPGDKILRIRPLTGVEESP